MQINVITGFLDFHPTPHPRLRIETDPVFETLCFLVSRIMNDGEIKKTVILSIIHHHQNPLESRRTFMYTTMRLH
jgi:hypothetical protein